jgi:hypothetical protein
MRTTILLAAGLAVAAPRVVCAQSATTTTRPDTIATVHTTAPSDTTAKADTTKKADSTAKAKPKAPDPFAFGDFTWLNGNSREHQPLIDGKYFTAEIRVDVNYINDWAQPKDHTLDGAAEAGRANEFQVQQLGVGGDFHWDNVRARVMMQFGDYSEDTPRDDASPAIGQYQLDNAYRYLSEAYGGYHWDAMNGINLDAGIFMSYIGLFSYYNADNWAYQPSYVSANTPWFFNGIRIQTFPSQKLKLEYWIVNGWQSYGMFNETPGLGMQTLWRPNGSVSFLSNDYWGYDTPGNPHRARIHSDNSFELKYRDKPQAFFDKSAFSVTADIGCESGGGVNCTTTSNGHPAQNFLGWMFYDRLWFRRDHYGVTIGGGEITNPGRYLVLLPPINGATAASGTPYFTENPGDKFQAWDASLTFDWMPNDWITFRAEPDHRAANVPYFVGPGGITPPGGNTGAPGSLVSGWAPDLRKTETRINFALLVKL